MVFFGSCADLEEFDANDIDGLQMNSFIHKWLTNPRCGQANQTRMVNTKCVIIISVLL